MTIANENPTLTASGKAGLTQDESYYYSLALTMPKGLLFVKAILIDRRVIKNSKSQISNNKQITMTEIQNSKTVLVIGFWNLFVIWCLEFGIS
jgi:hypothetical protein